MPIKLSPATLSTVIEKQIFVVYLEIMLYHYGLQRRYFRHETC